MADPAFPDHPNSNASSNFQTRFRSPGEPFNDFRKSTDPDKRSATVCWLDSTLALYRRFATEL